MDVSTKPVISCSHDKYTFKPGGKGGIGGVTGEEAAAQFKSAITILKHDTFSAIFVARKTINYLQNAETSPAMFAPT